jgi:hypothetical protein
MEIVYTEVEAPSGAIFIRAELDNGQVLLIPNDPANSDYQAYLKSLNDNSEAE